MGIGMKSGNRRSPASFRPGPTSTTVRSATGAVLPVPTGWVLLAPGDAALTRRVKADGEHWVVEEQRGRKVFSRGVWAPAGTIQRIAADLARERATQAFAGRKVRDALRRERAQSAYVEDFAAAVLAFLNFHPRQVELAQRLARAVAGQATPVGSGTVARTRRIPVEQRAEAAVIAWMRHQTTGYDRMVVPRVKGQRREIRRLLARRSHELLAGYRRGDPLPMACPLRQALLAPGTDAEPALSGGVET